MAGQVTLFFRYRQGDWESPNVGQPQYLATGAHVWRGETEEPPKDMAVKDAQEGEGIDLRGIRHDHHDTIVAYSRRIINKREASMSGYLAADKSKAARRNFRVCSPRCIPRHAVLRRSATEVWSAVRQILVYERELFSQFVFGKQAAGRIKWKDAHIRRLGTSIPPDMPASDNWTHQVCFQSIGLAVNPRFGKYDLLERSSHLTHQKNVIRARVEPLMNFGDKMFQWATVKADLRQPYRILVREQMPIRPVKRVRWHFMNDKIGNQMAITAVSTAQFRP